MFGTLTVIVLIPILVGLRSIRSPRPKLAVVPIEQVGGYSPGRDKPASSR
jgi:hypothetical protein